MAVRVTIKVFQRDIESRVILDNEVTVSRLIPALVKALELPIRDSSEQLIIYYLTYDRRRLQAIETLASAGVNHGDTLIIMPELGIHTRSDHDQTDLPLGNLSLNFKPSLDPVSSLRSPVTGEYEDTFRELETVSRAENTRGGIGIDSDVYDRMAVSLVDQNGDLIRRAKLASKIAISRLMPEIISQLALPITDSQGLPIIYHLSHEGRLLQGSTPLTSTNVRKGDTLAIIPQTNYIYQPRVTDTLSPSNRQTQVDIPPGFRLRHALFRHKQPISRIAWSPNGKMLASSSQDKTIQIWSLQTGKLQRALSDYVADITGIAWASNSSTLASVSRDEAIRIWNVTTGENFKTFTFDMADREIRAGISRQSGSVYSMAFSTAGETLASTRDRTIWLWNTSNGKCVQTPTEHTRAINVLAWSPDGTVLATGACDQSVRLWNTSTWQLYQILTGHMGDVNSLSWSPDGTMLVSSAYDYTVRIWNSGNGRQIRILQGHTDRIVCTSFSFDGRLLASQSYDGTIRIWDTASWQTVTAFTEASSQVWTTSLAFHPHLPILATLSGNVIHIWDVDRNALLDTTTTSRAEADYASAKVVLVGETAVEESCLSLALIGKPLTATVSTHACIVGVIDNQEIQGEDGRIETRETFLWDLAGQPACRIFHQLHLHEVSVALVVYDAHGENDPVACVEYWNHALNHARHLQGSSAMPLKKFLVVVPTDRGNLGVQPERIKTLVDKLGFDRYLVANTRSKKDIAKLKKAIQDAIDWVALPKVNAPDLFQSMKKFLEQEKETGQHLTIADDLYRRFLQHNSAYEATDKLRREFDACLRAMESLDLIRWFEFGDYVLLQPELLHNYACGLINAVRTELDQIGGIAEERILAGDIFIGLNKRIEDRDKEKILLNETVRYLLDNEIIIREPLNDKQFLLFPTQSTHENPDMSDPPGKEVVFRFAGPVQFIYTTLAVRLANSGYFIMNGVYKNAVTYTTRTGGTYGLCMAQTETGEGQGILTLFYYKGSEEQHFFFEDFIHTHLKRNVPREHLQRERVYICQYQDPETGRICNMPIPDSLVQALLKLGKKSMNCPACGSDISLLDGKERLDLSVEVESPVPKMEQDADAQRERATTVSDLQGKIASHDFDVFLCYNKADLPAVKNKREDLMKHGILPWLDLYDAQPGQPWQLQVEKMLQQRKAAAVFIGKSGIGPWQGPVVSSLLSEFVNRDCSVIPVLLEDITTEPEIPPFLNSMVKVDFRQTDPDPMERLIFGITRVRGPGW